MSIIKKTGDLSNSDNFIKEEQPLITFALFAYNQEEFIREAVNGAFSQTYSPLEIILSDDCSSDRTFEIMQEMVKEYKGPHHIILNKTKQNKGLAEHINQVFQLIKGEWVVMAAGDDTSFPHRVQTIHNYIDENCTAILSGYIRKYENEDRSEMCGISSLKHYTLEYISKDISRLGVGAAYAYKVENIISSIDYPPILGEDRVFPYEAAIHGEIYHIPDLLLRKRHLESSLTQVDRQENIEKAIERLTLTWATHDKILARALKEGTLSTNRYLKVNKYNFIGRNLHFLRKMKMYGRLANRNELINFYYYLFRSGVVFELVRKKLRWK
ncbi:glycosyltransferase family 2 protein [Lutibacter sp. HS1-25]|uniref:glycosyltransferase family 2 protein n=1 Tax=Lutibacter sp. HS1-25 TaxID=2485000 RepID=UPI001011D5DA|nr:glycosyltransferase family 2 protein [Lutibacter sp. HS1-25]RXP45407.1 glycosyltransferase family 2 protein [Lutibacter sp. HS1-25]